MPRSSTVWCWSTSRSPVASIRQVEAAVAGEQLEHVIEKADAGADLVAALAVERRSSARSAFRWSADRLPRGAQHLLHRGDAAAGVLDDAGGDADAAGAARLGRSGRAGRCRARRRPRTSASVRSPARDQHEVGGALPVVQPEPVARRVEQRLRFARPAGGSRRGRPRSSSAALHGDDGGDVDAVDRHRAAGSARARPASPIRQRRSAGRPGRTPSRTCGRR